MQILFVSGQDLYRGPVARVLASRHASEMGVHGLSFDSAGVEAALNAHSSPELVVFMRDQRLNLFHHVSKPLTGQLVRNADLLLAMTHELARAAKDAVGPVHGGKVVVLNEAVGFGRSAAEMDIHAPDQNGTKALMSLFTQLKASTGRLVRMVRDGDTSPRDFGAVAAETQPDRYLDDKHMRHFLVRYVREFIERAFEPPSTPQIADALAVMGRPLSFLDIEELLGTDLKGIAVRDGDGRWDIDERVKADEERRRREKPAGKRKPSEQPRESAPPPGGGVMREQQQLTEAAALELLAVTMETSRGEAQRAYRKLLMRYHPDKFHDDEDFRLMAESKTKLINLAWALLEDRLPE
ncbi:DnaJ domain-containing protein [Candidatus Poribacteria bacterium]|nr:DnaJ domain-containing protein [Candidatus Poribacteria bacterium]